MFWIESETDYDGGYYLKLKLGNKTVLNTNSYNFNQDICKYFDDNVQDVFSPMVELLDNYRESLPKYVRNHLQCCLFNQLRSEILALRGKNEV